MKKIISLSYLILLLLNSHADNLDNRDSLLCPNPPDDSVHKKVFFYDISYKGDGIGNVCGGLQTGGTYMGYAQIGIGFNLWHGAQIFVKGGNTHGGTFSETFVGDHQVCDNIEAGNHTFLQELWLSQEIYFQQVELIWRIKAGMQDFNERFSVCDPAGLFFNSSFGVPSALASDISLPIFPIMGWALNTELDIHDHMTIRLGAFDSPYGFEENPYNVHWRFNKNKGCFLAAEYEYRFKPKDANDYRGRYVAGVTYHTGEQEWRVHFNACHTIWQNVSRQLQLFVTGAISRKHLDNNHIHIGGGALLTGVFSQKGKDAMGLASSTAIMANLPNETVLELTYQYQIIENISLQPDIQYIINPCGTDMSLKSALVMGIRVEIGIE